MIALVLATVVLWLGGAFLGEFHCKLPKLYLSNGAFDLQLVQHGVTMPKAVSVGQI